MKRILQQLLSATSKSFLAVSLIFFFLAAVFIGNLDLRYEPLWTIGDWLINYSAGFVRRGFPGEIFLLLSHLLHIRVPWLAFAIPALVYGVFLLFVYRMANPLRRNFLWYAMLYSPATIPFIVLGAMDIGFRKETLLFAFLAAFMYMLQKGARDLLLGCTVAAMFTVLVLSHEGTLICFPYFVAAMALVTGSIKRSIKTCAIPLLIALGLFVVVSRHPGVPSQAMDICRSIDGHWTDLPSGKIYPGLNGETGLCTGSIAWIGKPLSLYQKQRAEANPLPLYILRIPFTFLPFCLALLWMYRKDKLRYEVWVVAGTAILCFIGCIALLAAALDWGRWIHTQAVCLMLVTLLAAQRAKSFAPAEEDQEHRNTPKQVVTSYVLGLLTLLYCVTWTLPTNSWFPVRNGYESLQVDRAAIHHWPSEKEARGTGEFGEPK